MKGVFIFNSKSDLIFWTSDSDVENYINLQLNKFSTDNDTKLQANNLDRLSISYLFLPLTTTFKAYKSFSNSCYRHIRTDLLSFVFTEVQNLLMIVVLPPNSTKRTIYLSKEMAKSALSFTFGVFAELMDVGEMKSQTEYLKRIMNGLIENMDSITTYTNVNGLINEQKIETDHFVTEISKELIKFSQQNVSFLIIEKQLLSVSCNGRLTKRANFHSTDVQKVVDLAYDWSAKKSNDCQNVNHTVVMILDHEAKSRSPWILIKWDLSRSVYLIVLAPLGFNEVFSCLHEILTLIPKDFADKLSIGWRQSIRLNNLLIRLQKSLQSYGAAFDTVCDLKICLNSITTPNYVLKNENSELNFDTKIGLCRKLMNNLLTFLWRQLIGDAQFCKTEFVEKHIVDLITEKMFYANFNSLLAELPPYNFEGPSPNSFQLDALCYRIKFHNRNICMGFKEIEMLRLVKLETATQRFKEVRMIRDARCLSIIESSWSAEDCWTIVVVFEPFVNLKLASKQTSCLGSLLRQLIADNACAFQILFR